MKRLAIFVGCLMLVASTVEANSTFNKFWKEKFLPEDVDSGFKDAARKQGCYICHVYGEKKDEVRNEYGTAIHEYLKAEDFPKDYVKDNPDEAKAKIWEGFAKAGKHKSKDGKTFEDKIKNNEIPATDSGKE